jgi:TPR repeat protein
LADLYVQGQEGYEVDLVKGREYYEKASAKGHLEVLIPCTVYRMYAG